MSLRFCQGCFHSQARGLFSTEEARIVKIGTQNRHRPRPNTQRSGWLGANRPLHRSKEDRFQSSHADRVQQARRDGSGASITRLSQGCQIRQPPGFYFMF